MQNDPADEGRPPATLAKAGLCATCLHCRIVKTERSTFYLCQRSFTDPRYLKYPPIPVRECPGYEPGSACQP
jgi:hypothetical protein